MQLQHLQKILCYSFIISLVSHVFMVISHQSVTNLPSPKISWQSKQFLGNYKDCYHFLIFGCVTFLSFYLFVIKAQYLLSKSSNKFRIFTVAILYHLFILKILNFLVSNRNKSYDKKVTGYRNIHNPAFVFFQVMQECQ